MSKEPMQTREQMLRAMAVDTYRKVRIAHPHMPDPGTAEGQRKIDRLEAIMLAATKAPTP